MRIAALRTYPLHAAFADMFGGLRNVPASLLSPASHFRRIKRLGQYATLVEVECTDGAVGWGEAFGLPHPIMTASLITAVIAPALVGLEVAEPVAATADLRDYFAALGHTRGPAMEALSAVDIALWDLDARRNGKPLAALLGGAPGAVRAYVGSVAFLDAPAQSADKARGFVADGFGGVKLKVGRGLAVDRAHAEAVRDAIGPDVELMLDANAGYDVDTAIVLARALEDLDIAWLEEPIPPDDPAALAAVRRAVRIPIAAGENEFTLAQFEALAKAGAVDILQPNITRAGGVSGFVAIDRLCARHGIALAPHGVGSAIGLAAAVHACRALSSFRVYEANRLLNPLRDDMAEVVVPFADGCFFATDRLGHGVEPRREILEHYALRAREMAHGAA